MWTRSSWKQDQSLVRSRDPIQIHQIGTTTPFRGLISIMLISRFRFQELYCNVIWGDIPLLSSPIKNDTILAIYRFYVFSFLVSAKSESHSIIKSTVSLSWRRMLLNHHKKNLNRQQHYPVLSEFSVKHWHLRK